MSSVIIAGNTSGTITLDAPNVAGTTVLTLPTANGTVLTTGSPQSGSVVQTIYASTTTAWNTTSASYVATPLTATINKAFSSSKILIFFCPNVQAYGLSVADARAAGMLYDTTNARQIIDYNCVNRSYGSTGTHTSSPNLGLQAYDTNSGTGNRQYTFYLKMTFGTGVNFNLDTNGDATSTMVLMEIAS
jgi:hypothetical protein